MIEIKLLPEADHDVASAALWYEHYHPERRAAFLREYRATVERPLRFPHAGSPIVDLKAPFLVRRFWIKETSTNWWSWPSGVSRAYRYSCLGIAPAA
jgi:plasmid stabilization system protein ParE